MLYTNAICHSSGWDPEHLLQKDTIITINFCIAVLTCQVFPLVFCMGRSFPSINIYIPLILSACETSATGSSIWDATKKGPIGTIISREKEAFEVMPQLGHLLFRWRLRLMVQKSGDHQLRSVVYPIIHSFLYVPGGDRRISSISSISRLTSQIPKNTILQRNTWCFFAHYICQHPRLIYRLRPHAPLLYPGPKAILYQSWKLLSKVTVNHYEANPHKKPINLWKGKT